MSTLPNDQKAADLAQLANLYKLQARLNRIQRNLALINNVPNAKIITIVSRNLFDIATEYYDDATQWTQIAAANGLIDPFIKGVKQLIIPPLSADKSGGLINA